MYTTRNFKTKREFKAAVAAYNETQAYSDNGIDALRVKPVTLWSPGGLGTPNTNGVEFVEGPHFPAPHTWYAQVVVKDGIVIKVK